MKLKLEMKYGLAKRSRRISVRVRRESEKALKKEQLCGGREGNVQTKEGKRKNMVGVSEPRGEG